MKSVISKYQRKLFWAFCLLFISTVTLGQSLPDDEYELIQGLDSVDRVPNQYIVVLKEDAALDYQLRYRSSAIEQVATLHALEITAAHGGDVDKVYSHALNGFLLKNADENIAREVAKNPAVAYVVADRMAYPDTTQSPATWGLDRIDQRDLPLDNSYTFSNEGNGVNVYVIDSGIRATHNDFGGRVKSGFSAVNDGRGTNDCLGHGTHVAGTIGGATYGVAKSVNLYPVRVFGCTGSAPYSTIISGIDWVAANFQSPAVVNMSLSGPADGATDQAVNNLINKNITVVVSAGNNGADACDRSPARVPRAITVGNTISTDARNSGSNFGTCLDLFAPGTTITSAWYTSNTAINNLTGTSMSSPHVAGVAARYKQNQPSASPDDVASFITSSASNFKVSNPGVGSPNRLLYSVLSSGSGVPGRPTGLFGDRLCNGSYRLTWNASSGSANLYELYFSSDPSFSSQLLVSAQEGRSKTVAVGPPGARAHFRVRACNNNGCGGYSDPITLNGFGGCL